MLQPKILIRYGLIPEFVGPLAGRGVIAMSLDEAALIKILTEPKTRCASVSEEI